MQCVLKTNHFSKTIPLFSAHHLDCRGSWASARDVMRLVLRQSLGMIFAGVGVGILAALAAERLLMHTVDGMRPTEPSTFAIMIPLLVAAALFASFLPARRASRIDPMSALRQE